MDSLSARSKRFLKIIAEHFCTHSSWPDATELQRSLIRADATEELVVWDEVEHLPGDLLRREPTGDGRELLVLTVEGLVHSGGARPELDAFVRLARYFAEVWKRGDDEVPERSFAQILGVTGEVAKRTALILRSEWLVAHSRTSNDDETFWKPARSSAFRFREVASVDDYLSTVAAIKGQSAPVESQDSGTVPEEGGEVVPASELERSLPPDAKRGFLLMPFDGTLAWLHQAIRRAGARAGVRMERADDISSPGVVLEQIFRAIDEADVVVSVCTSRNPNVFFEMGYAWRDHNVILVAAGGDDLAFDVQHYRTVLYGGRDPGEDRASFEERLRGTIASVLLEERLPRGRRLSEAPPVKQVVRLGAQLEGRGRNSDRLVLTNAGSVSVNEVDVSIPDEVQSFGLVGDGLPLKTLRPGQSVPLLASRTMGGGPAIFDLAITGVTDDGQAVEELVTISLYA